MTKQRTPKNYKVNQQLFKPSFLIHSLFFVPDIKKKSVVHDGKA